MFGNPKVSDDLNDSDNDSATDKFIDIVWLDFNANFPGEDLPAKLATITFSSSEQSIDPISGELLSSSINFTSNNTAQNYGFSENSILLNAFPFNLDVDGDGKITALGDGLMVIRKLFGSAFAGNALTNKAISDNATRTTDEIHEYIQSGIDSQTLDVDHNEQVTALGDGLMIIRHLFGSAFSGNALIDKAISKDSPYYGEDDASQMVADNINSLFI